MIDRATAPEDSDEFQGRLTSLTVLIGIALAIVVGRVFYLGVIVGPELRERSADNYISHDAIDAPRGSIRDRRGKVMATSQMVFHVVARAHKLDHRILTQSLERLGALTEQDYAPQISQLAPAPGRRMARSTKVVLAGALPIERAGPILERLETMPGIGVEPGYRRYYPQGILSAHILGFVGAIPREQYAALREKGYNIQDTIGRSRIERLCESDLRGEKGVEVVRRDAAARVREVLYDLREPARPGKDVTLTIDLDLQRLANELITTRSLELISEQVGETVRAHRPAVMVAMDPHTGEIIAMASYPTFDPNHPGSPGPPDSPYKTFDGALMGAYMPGSSFKLVTAYAALRAGVSPTRQVNCTGKFYIRGWNSPYMCDNEWGHKLLDMPEALQHSCNVYFYTMANELGARRLIEAARELGFGEKTGIEIVGSEAKGMLPTKRLLPGEVLHLAIGQNQVLVTPLQVLRAYAAMANGGRLVRPYVVARVGDREVMGLNTDDEASSRTIDMRPEWREPLVEGLWRVANVTGGTAWRVKFPREWNVVGKTSSVEEQGQNVTNAWFVCFAPRDNPVIAVIAMVKEAGHGAAIAAPLCREFLEEYFRLYPLPASTKYTEPETLAAGL